MENKESTNSFYNNGPTHHKIYNPNKILKLNKKKAHSEKDPNLCSDLFCSLRIPAKIGFVFPKINQPFLPNPEEMLSSPMVNLSFLLKMLGIIYSVPWIFYEISRISAIRSKYLLIFSIHIPNSFNSLFKLF